MNNPQNLSSRLLPWFVWSLGAAFFFSEYFARVSPSVMVEPLMKAFSVNALQLGSLSAFFYFSYISLQIPVGMLVDRYGPRLLLAVMALCCALGALLFASAKVLIVAEVGRLLMGVGAAFAFVGSLKLAATWFSPQRFGLLAGLTQALGMLGAAVGEGPVAWGVSQIGWRDTVYLMVAVFLVLSALIAVVVRDKPKNYVQPRNEHLATGRDVLAGLRHVLSNPQTWWNALYIGLLYAPTAAFAELWGTTFVSTDLHVRTDYAATGISLIFIGWCIGGPIVGWFSDRIRRRKPLLIASPILSGIIISIIIFSASLSLMQMYILMFFYGVVNTGVAISYAVAKECNDKSLTGTALGFTNMASVIIGASLQPVIGWMLDRTQHTAVTSVSQFSLSDFQHALIVLPLCFVLSAIMVVFVKESYPRAESEQS